MPETEMTLLRFFPSIQRAGPCPFCTVKFGESGPTVESESSVQALVLLERNATMEFLLELLFSICDLDLRNLMQNKVPIAINIPIITPTVTPMMRPRDSSPFILEALRKWYHLQYLKICNLKSTGLST
jgi:hypothetical protein